VKRDGLQTLPCRSKVAPGTTQTARSSRAVTVVSLVVTENSERDYLTVGREWSGSATASQWSAADAGDRDERGGERAERANRTTTEGRPSA
jgi:hypothetical protein